MATQDMVQSAQLNEPKSSVGIYELPCGYLDADGALHSEIELREITGYEEDMLASKQIQPQKKINELVTRCTVRVGTITDRSRLIQVIRDLPVGDRVYILFAVRRVTLGDDYPFEDKCPNDECGAVRLYNIDLSQLDVKKMPDPRKRVFDATLRNGKQIRFRTLTGADEDAMLKLQKSADSLSLALMTRLELYDGKPVALPILKQMGMTLRTEIRDVMEETDGGVETEVDMTCPDCGTDFKRELDVGQQGFFFPSVVQKTWKRRSST